MGKSGLPYMVRLLIFVTVMLVGITIYPFTR